MRRGKDVPESRALVVIGPESQWLALPDLSSGEESSASLIRSATRLVQGRISRVVNEIRLAQPVGQIMRLPLGKKERVLAVSEQLSGKSGQLRESGGLGGLGRLGVLGKSGAESLRPVSLGGERAIVVGTSLSGKEPRLVRQTRTVKSEPVKTAKDFRGRPTRPVQFFEAGQRNLFDGLFNVFQPRELVLVPAGASAVSRPARPASVERSAVPVEFFSRFTEFGSSGRGERREIRQIREIGEIRAIKESIGGKAMEQEKQKGGFFEGLRRLVQPERTSLVVEPKPSRAFLRPVEMVGGSVQSSQLVVEIVTVEPPGSRQRGRQGSKRRVVAIAPAEEHAPATVRQANRSGGRTLNRREFIRLSALAVAGATAAACAPRQIQTEAAPLATDTPPPTGTRRPTAAPVQKATAMVVKPPVVEATSTQKIVEQSPVPTVTEDPKVREEGERQTRLAVSPQLVWLSPEDKNRLLHESNPNKDDVEKQTNALRLCAQKWVQEKEFGYAGGVVNRAKLVVFNREDGTVLVGLELVDPRGVGDYAPGNLVFALNVEQSVEKEILIPISYQEADALPTERRPEPTFVTVNVDGLLGTDLEGNPITADGLALEDGTFVAYRKEMKIGRINPRHIGKRAGSDQSETYPGWELTKQGRTAYVEQNPSGLTEEQRRQWKLFYEDIEPETAELKKQGAVINFDFQSSIFPSVVEGENGQAMAVWSSKKGTWLEAKILPVKTDKQDKSLSCESSAAGMIAQYFNPNPPKDYSTWEEYIMSIPLNCNPDKGYRGAINGGLSTSCDAAAGLGYGVHAEPVAKILQKAGLDAEAVYSVDFNWLKEQIDNGSLAVVWVSGKTDPLVEWHQDDDESKYYTILGEHAITVVGYFVDRHQEGEKTVEKTFFVTNDPTSGTQYPVAGFYNWGLFNNMTLVVRGLNNRREPKFES